uniref:Arg8-vasotocin receptor-like n=1 Tax=Geotrypetes seraphini TaxID=260995 RepID=A0A6P8SBR6_GEOSA|nr:arg8-vasotocin receptor-like [Geotrypetes seraphini]
MTVDRYQAVCYPVVTFQKKRALWNAAICTSWSISLTFSLPQLFIFSKTELTPGIYECWAVFIQPWGLKAYVTWIFVIIFFIPTTILIMCQVKICRIIRMNIYMKKHSAFELTNEKQILPSRASSINCISKAMIKTVKMTVVTVVVYVLCWAPFFTVQLWSVWFPSRVTEERDPKGPTDNWYRVTLKAMFGSKHIKGAAFTIIMLLGNLNSCTNPWIYLYFCGHIPHCVKQSEHISMREETIVTASINFADREPEDNVCTI